jgi:hypothetical protein
MKKRFTIKWLDEDKDLNVRHFKRYEHSVTWFKVLNSLIRAGERLEIIQAPRR